MTWLEEKMSEAKKIPEYNQSKLIDQSSDLKYEPDELLRLNSNENLFLNINDQQKNLLKAVYQIDPRLYSSTTNRFIPTLASYLGVSSDSLIIGNGSDQLIELLINSFIDPNDAVISINPTFSIYSKAVKIRKGVYQAIDLNNDFSLNLERIIDALSGKTRILLLCNPNNPTGNQFQRKKIENLLDVFEGLVIIDEAYAEYAKYSVINQVNNYDNLIVLRTFSKAYGLAGLRLGYAVTNEKISKILRTRFQMPYTVSELVQMVGCILLENNEPIKNAIKKVKTERKRLINELNKIPKVHAFNSDTNFVLFSLPFDALIVRNKLIEKGIIVRYYGNILEHKNCLRVTVPPKDKSRFFISTLKEVLSNGK